MMNTPTLRTQTSRDRDPFLKAHLDRLRSELVRKTTALLPDTREGAVMSLGPAPYRRIDCDGRALAYIRTRPRKGVVRVDVSGLWLVPRDAAIAHPSASGSATLYLQSLSDVLPAVRFLEASIRTTRAAYARAEVRQ